MKRQSEDMPKNALWNNYKKFYISQSTAFITPILYIFLNEEFGIDPAVILKVSAFYWMLSLALQIPCGMLADHWGVKRNLYTCLCLQGLSCVSLLLIHNIVAYHVYLICINLADGLCASASSILIRQQFQDSEAKEYKNFSFKLQNSFYLTTSFLILFSAFLYTVNPFIPFVLQIGNFLVSAFFLSKIPEQFLSMRKSNKTLFTCAKEDIQKAFRFLFMEKFYLYLIVCAVFFGLAVSMSQKNIQIQLFPLFTSHQVMMIGACIAVSNLFSSLGAKAFYKWISKHYTLRVEMVILTLLLTFSFLAMSFDSLYSVILGFMFINLFKGCYRPLLNAELINKYPFNGSRSTNLALITTLVIIASSLFQYILASFYHDIFFGNLIFAIIAAGVLLPLARTSEKTSSWHMPAVQSSLSGKKSYVFKRQGEMLFAQIYPHDVSEQELEIIPRMANQSNYPTEKLTLFFKVNGLRGIETKFLGETHLSDILDETVQYRICEKLIDQMIPGIQVEHPARIMPIEHILPPTALQLFQRDQKLSQMCIIHGDLHPGNVIVVDHKPYVIDWDLSGAGPLWYDLLSLLSHPDLYFDKEKRFQLFLKQTERFNYDDLNLIFHLFCRFKHNQTKQFVVQNPKYQRLVSAYHQQMNLFSY